MRLFRLAILGLSACLAGCLQPTDGVEPAETFITVERELLPNELSRADAAGGWIKLFDGETLFGWTQPEHKWRVEKGAFVCDGDGPATLSTTTRFADYELRWEAWIDSTSAGSVVLRASGDASGTEHSGYEIRLGAADQLVSRDAGSRATAGLLPIGRGEWSACSATIESSRITLDSGALQDSPAQFSDDVPAESRVGHISLVSAEGTIKVRSVFLKPLGMQPLFNKQDLTGWRNAPGRTSEFEAIVRGKESRIYAYEPGAYLETDESFDDFVFQADVIFNGQGYDAGILFRALDGTAESPAQGYELQLNNAVLPEDRSQPKDFGTGGLYGLVAARRQIASDLSWFVPTLVADGPHIAVWVNGEQVTDWTDLRAPHENPREGLRTTAGRIGLEAAGEEIDFFLQNLWVARLPTHP